MNERADIDRVLREFFSDGPSGMPDRVVVVVADRITRQRQRRAWHLSWRPQIMSSLKPIVAIAAVLIVAVIGWRLLPGRGTEIGGTVATPSPVPSESPFVSSSAAPSTTPTPSPSPTPLAAGTYSTVMFRPRLTFTVPDGWILTADDSASMSLQDGRNPNIGQIATFNDVVIISSAADCPQEPEPGVGRTADEMIANLRANPGLTVTGVKPATVGSLPGQQLDIVVAPGWTRPCPFSAGNPAVPLFTDSHGAGFSWGMGPGAKQRLYVLDRGDGTAIVVILDGTVTTFADLEAAAAPIVGSFEFEATPSPS